jgi:hypothetical protein
VARLIPLRWLLLVGVLVASGASASRAAAQDAPIVGTWRVDANKKFKDGPREVIIRADSSASWGKETVRWRLKPGDQISIVIGGEWETYKIKVKTESLTLSGGDLSEAITLKKVGPATPRDEKDKIPEDPDKTGR